MLSGGKSVEALFEVFNLTNSDNNIVSQISGGLLFDFSGTIRSGTGDPRQAQIGVRFRFSSGDFGGDWGMRSSLLRRSVLAAALAAVVSAAPQAADRKLEIEWVDVLGGAATLIVTPAGESILVDTGWPGFDSRDAKRIKAALDRHGLTAIDHLVITHYHADHYGGVPQLAALVPIRHFYDHGPMSALPEDRNFAEMYGAYRAAAKDTTTTLKPGDTIALKQGTGPKLTLTVVAANGEVARRRRHAGQPGLRLRGRPARRHHRQPAQRRLRAPLRQPSTSMTAATSPATSRRSWPARSTASARSTSTRSRTTGRTTATTRCCWPRLKPTVAVMNNGPRKGGAAETFRRLRRCRRCKGLFAIHKNASTGPEVNAAPENIANLEARRRRRTASAPPSTRRRSSSRSRIPGRTRRGRSRSSRPRAVPVPARPRHIMGSSALGP